MLNRRYRNKMTKKRGGNERERERASRSKRILSFPVEGKKKNSEKWEKDERGKGRMRWRRNEGAGRHLYKDLHGQWEWNAGTESSSRLCSSPPSLHSLFRLFLSVSARETLLLPLFFFFSASLRRCSPNHHRVLYFFLFLDTIYYRARLLNYCYAAVTPLLLLPHRRLSATNTKSPLYTFARPLSLFLLLLTFRLTFNYYYASVWIKRVYCVAKVCSDFEIFRQLEF